MDDKLVQQLEKLNFNNIEAKVYITLVKYSQMNGSQIAKKISTSRSSVYSALNNLYSRGVVYLIPGDTNMYRAENPETLMEKLRSAFEETTNTLREELLHLEDENNENTYYNLNGTENFISKARELLSSAKHEVYINTCIDLKIFKKELEALAKRAVRVIVFTYSSMDIEDLPVELYRHPIESCSEDKDSENEKRLMIVIDLKRTLICSSKGRGMELSGTFTEDTLLANIVAEHIHHDIYLLKLKENHKKELINKDILLSSLLENKGQNNISLSYPRQNVDK